MNLPEDRHPLLYVYLDNDQPERVRSRCVSQGASTVLGKWPDHLTFSWMMAVIGLVSLMTCFLLAVILLMVASSGHHPVKRSLFEKCERNEHVIQLVHMKNLEDLTINENATYFVEVYHNETQYQDSLCSVESFLRVSSLPVFLVTIFPNKFQENSTLSRGLEVMYKNFKTITFDINSFFDRTVFSSLQSQDTEFLTFLAKVLVSWNVGGTVIDSKVRILKDFQSVLPTDDKSIVIGRHKDDVVITSARRFCHAFIFDVLKTITETKNVYNYSEYSIVKSAKRRFCHGKWSCKAVISLTIPEICGSQYVNDGCIFLVPEELSMFSFDSENSTQKSLCPFIKDSI